MCVAHGTPQTTSRTSMTGSRRSRRTSIASVHTPRMSEAGTTYSGGGGSDVTPLSSDHEEEALPHLPSRSSYPPQHPLESPAPPPPPPPYVEQPPPPYPTDQPQHVGTSYSQRSSFLGGQYGTPPPPPHYPQHPYTAYDANSSFLYDTNPYGPAAAGAPPPAPGSNGFGALSDLQRIVAADPAVRVGAGARRGCLSWFEGHCTAPHHTAWRGNAWHRTALHHIVLPNDTAGHGTAQHDIRTQREFIPRSHPSQ